jgi:cytoskeletal protein RodZ
MAVARETEETVSSGSETKAGTRTNSGAQSRNAAEGASDQAMTGRDARSVPEIKPDSASSAASAPSTDPPKEPSKMGAESEPSLGKTLAAARERRGVSRADVVRETRIPAHYLEMIESSDYGLISDQLYLMPFLRRYASFLNLDGEEIAMRFVREVQRAEGAAPRMSEPFALHDHKRTPWGRMAAVIIVLSAIVVLYIIASRHHRGEFGFHQGAPPPPVSGAPAAVVPAPAAPMAAPAPMTEPRPAAPAQLPETSISGGPAVPAASQPQKPPPSHTTAPAGNNDE